MKKLKEEELEKFIRDNKDKFNADEPELGHNQHFLNKLINKFKEVINIVPYLVKVGLATVVIFTLSFLIWRIYISPPLTSISLKYWKAEHDLRFQIRRSTQLAHTYITNSEEKAKFDIEIQKFDNSYKILRKQLKENPTADNIAQMLRFYQDKLLELEDNIQNYTNKNTQSK